MGDHEGPTTPPDPIPEPHFYKLGEAARIVGVAPSAIRYWQAEFAAFVRPVRTRAGQHVFSRRDLRALGLIRHLLHTEGLSAREARDRMPRLMEREDAAAAAQGDGEQGVLELGLDGPPAGPAVPVSVELDALQHQAGALQAERDALRERASTAARERDAAQARLAEAFRERDEALGRAVAAVRELDDARTRLAQSAQAIETARTRLAEAVRERDEAASRLAGVTRERDNARQCLASAERDLVEARARLDTVQREMRSLLGVVSSE